MLEVLFTVEIRWFYPGSIPDSVEEWFALLGPGLSREVARIDYYLSPARWSRQRDHRGIKFREGRLEIKDRIRSAGIIQLGSRVTGELESWQKWGFHLKDGDSTTADDLVDQRDWIAVVKERAMRRYNVDNKGNVAVSDPGQLTVDCEMELSSVRVGDETWWTLALEAPGNEEQGVFALTATGHEALGSDVAPNLTMSNSKSYPNWMSADLANRKGDNGR